MNVTEAVKVWKEAKLLAEKYDPQLKAAAEVLKDYFRRNKKTEYRGVGYALTSVRQLDRKKVEAELGDRLDEFKVRVPRETLSLLAD